MHQECIGYDKNRCAMRNKLSMHWIYNAYDKHSYAMHWDCITYHKHSCAIK